MIPREEDLMFCIMRDGEVVDGAHGLAIGTTEAEAWRRAVEPFEQWTVERAMATGATVRRCALMVINP